MFERIDKEEDGEVYIREVVDFLRVLDNDIEQSMQESLRHKKFNILDKCVKIC